MTERSKVYYLDLLERALSTFVQGFLIAATVVAGAELSGEVGSIALPTFEELFSVATLQGGLVGGALSLAKGFLAGYFGDKNSAALLPKPPDYAKPT